MLNQQEREGVIVYSASVGGRWVCLCIFVDRGQINAESEPVQQRECSDKGVSTSGIIAGVNKNVSKFLTRKPFSNDEGWNKLEDPCAEPRGSKTPGAAENASF